jgi:ABC-type polysaccharide/polyol phosphate transport system ATPase subunit
MSSPGPAIRARGLRKAYRQYANATDSLLELIMQAPRHSERVALDSVDLELKRGEIVGILGRNGAGKSTLLKIIAGTLERTSGELEISGRITAILELGTGFHPEYTGRENIRMGGLCLGMSRAEIDRKIESIIDFSELRDVIDQPFKTYSTGMQARLTFSTAISVEPEILIVDEALSVGDARFQMKCFGWIQKLKQRNATILLVSHDTNTITTFCDRALILENGRIFAEGDAKPMTVLYHNLLFGKVATSAPEIAPCEGTEGNPVSSSSRTGSERPLGATAKAAPSLPAGASAPPSTPTPDQASNRVRYGSEDAVLVEWGLYDEQNRPCSLIQSGAKCRLAMRLECRKDISDLSCGFAIKDRKGTVVWGETNITHAQESSSVRAGELLTIASDLTMWLADGDYFVTLGAAHVADGAKIDFIEDAIQFRVVGPGGIFTTSVVNLDSCFSIARTQAGDISAALQGAAE